MKKMLFIILFALSGQSLLAALSSEHSISRASKKKTLSVASLRRAEKMRVVWKCCSACDEYYRLHKDGKNEQVSMAYFQQRRLGWIFYDAESKTCTINLRDLELSSLHGLSKLLHDFNIHDEEVTQIRLDNNCLEKLPKKLSRFTNLTHLFLEGNPDVVLPWSLGASKRIRYLRLDKIAFESDLNYKLLVQYAKKLKVLK